MAKKKFTSEDARNLLDELGVEDKVRTHSEGVAHRVQMVCSLLKPSKLKIDTEKATAAALLHDLGRTRPHGLDHALVSAQMLEERGIKDIAEIVKVHALPQTAELPIEAKILIYADTTTGPDGDSIDPMKKLGFLQRLGEEWKNETERLMAKEAFEVKRRIVSEIDTLIKRSMSRS